MESSELNAGIESRNRLAATLTPAEFWKRANHELDQLQSENPAVLFVSIPEIPLSRTETLAIDVDALNQPVVATFSDSTREITKALAPVTTSSASFSATPQSATIVQKPEKANSQPSEVPAWTISERSVDFSPLELQLTITDCNLPADLKPLTNQRNTVTLICDSEQAAAAGLAGLVAARRLAERWNEPVLLIDGQRDSAGLSEQLGVETLPGWTDIVKLERPWQSTVLKSNVSQLYFLPTGVVNLRTQSAGSFFEPRLQQLIDELQSQFRFVIVTTGTAFDSGVSAWAKFCNDTWLTACPETASQSLTRAAVDQLRSARARVSGLVVTKHPQVI